jgi:hypothetical protein
LALGERDTIDAIGLHLLIKVLVNVEPRAVEFDAWLVLIVQRGDVYFPWL